MRRWLEWTSVGNGIRLGQLGLSQTWQLMYTFGATWRQVALIPFHRCCKSGHFVVSTGSPFSWPDIKSPLPGVPLFGPQHGLCHLVSFLGLGFHWTFKSWGAGTVLHSPQLPTSPVALTPPYQQHCLTCRLAHFDLKDTVLPKFSFSSRPLWLPVISPLCSSISL